MYLLTFVTLLIGIIGIYTQVIAVQTARLTASQTGIAPAVYTWHAAATSMAHSIIATNAGFSAGSGCSLTFSLIGGASSPFTQCIPPVGVPETKGTVADGATPPALGLIPNPASPANNMCVNLPSTCTAFTGSSCTACTANYDLTNYQFYSILFASGTQNYVVTVIPPAKVSASNPAPGYITAVPSGSILPVTISGLMQQFKNTSYPNYSYGSIVTNASGTSVHTGGTCYTAGVAGPCIIPLPSTFDTLGLNGGIAMIGSP